MEDKFDEFKAAYSGLDEAKKTEFREIFEGSDVLRDRASLEMWINENAEEPEELATAKSSVEACMASC